MMKVLSLPLFAALAVISLSTPLSAQSRGTVTGATLDAAVAAPAATSRAVVTSALTSREAISAAGKLGVTAGQLTARVAALDDASVNQYADRILAGGRANVVISTTAIIIGLLILILLIG